ncbi:MAG: DUF4476 domain-containing protein [Nannocystaceae bacterium]
MASPPASSPSSPTPTSRRPGRAPRCWRSAPARRRGWPASARRRGWPPSASWSKRAAAAPPPTTTTPAETTPATTPATTPTTTPTTTPAPAVNAALTRIVDAINKESASSDKLSALKFSAKNARLTAAEGRQVLDLFAFSGDKMEALRFLRDKISDPDNWTVLVDAFAYSADREEARGLAP